MHKKVLLFDGVCNLCDGAVKFIIKHDKRDCIVFASLQGEVGRALLKKYNIDPAKTDSMVFIDEDKVFVKSSAVLRISKYLDKAFPLAYPLIFIPKFIRNGVYDFVAKNRYKWYGKKESCMIPTPELKAKFIDS
ncbi:MAG: thiol-disulfide oxidoreductase [Cytophagaceae bacterium]|nr:thiol-disulfide oxidoreductase [Cytophagaceae bacterium]